jgi:DMSO/TMAO reductase YedYZ molybdopterin-dependent catalytic subunit
MARNEVQFLKDKILLSEEPLVLETPCEKLNQFITPTKSFYVRTHFPVPKIDKGKWRLRIEGEVENPFEINFTDLAKLASTKIPATLECAGNNRSSLEPKVKVSGASGETESQKTKTGVVPRACARAWSGAVGE